MKISGSISRVAVVGCLIIAAVVATLATTPAWAKNNGGGVGTLSADEADHLTYMREEEKMARDVYLLMHEKYYDAVIFSNIAVSEQKHMDALKSKLDKYKLPDPVGDNAEGVFTNEELQDLYDYLVGLGGASLVAALEVGVLIEETDMIDIQEAIDHTDHADVVNTYENLLAGSENHLAAFEGALDAIDK